MKACRVFFQVVCVSIFTICSETRRYSCEGHVVAIHHAKQFNYYISYCPVVSFHVLLTKIRLLDLVIWRLWTFFFGVYWSHRFMLISPRHVKHWKKKLHAASMKYRNIYAKRFWKEHVYLCQQSRGDHLPDVLFRT